MVNTNIQYYYTEVELVENTYSIFAQVNVEYTEEEHSDEHPYGDGTATHNYTQLGDIMEVKIESWHREFDCSDELSVWIPEHLREYSGETGLDSNDIKKIKRLAECKLQESL
tara:strand:- start:150 stop:485 length:336 start_codon:yes stop_codon:yes gene_type:complete